MSRSESAKHAHAAILKYIRDDCSCDFVRDAINGLSNDSILELSVNGDSHLIDILHLPLAMESTHFAAKSNFLVRTLLNRAAVIGPQATVFLLLTPNNAGFTPLHDVLMSGNLENVRVYLDALHGAVGRGFLTHTEHQHLQLRASNKVGYTPLHQAAYSGSLDVVTIFLNDLKKTLNPEQYRKTMFTYVNGHLPSCKPQKPGAREINRLLFAERQALDAPVRISENNKFFSRKRPVPVDIDRSVWWSPSESSASSKICLGEYSCKRQKL